MSDRSLVLIVLISFIMLSMYDLMTLYNSYMCIDAVSKFGVLVVSSLAAYAIKTNKNLFL